VALFRAGNEQAFTVIHERYRQRLFAYARQMLAGSRQDAEDALQDVFVRAYSGLRANDRPLTLKAWLYRVAHNRCIDDLRRCAPAPIDVFDAGRTPMHDPLDVAERRENLRRLVADVQDLPEQQRSVLLMREIDGLSYDELAAAHDVSLPAVKSLLVRARMGLVEARRAREIDCQEIREQLCLAADRGVRSSGIARRHLRECTPCREFRGALRDTRKEFAAILPLGVGPLGLLAQVFGLGSGSGAAAASGGGAAVTGSALGGSAATITATKVCAVVCTAVVGAGGAIEVSDTISSHRPAKHARTLAPSPRPTLNGGSRALPSIPLAKPATAGTAAGPSMTAPATGAGAPAAATPTAPASDTAPANDGVAGGSSWPADSTTGEPASDATTTAPTGATDDPATDGDARGWTPTGAAGDRSTGTKTITSVTTGSTPPRPPVTSTTSSSPPSSSTGGVSTSSTSPSSSPSSSPSTTTSSSATSSPSPTRTSGTTP